MTSSMDRRDFLAKTGRASLGLGVLPGRVPFESLLQERSGIVVAVMGVNSRGNELAQAFTRLGADVRYICDVDARAVEATVGQVGEVQERRPLGVTDFRLALDDQAVSRMWSASNETGASIPTRASI